MDVRLITAFLVVQAGCIAVIAGLTLQGVSLGAVLFLTVLAIGASLYLRFRYNQLSSRLRAGLERLSMGDLNATLDPDAGPPSWQRIAIAYNALINAMIQARDAEARHLAGLESKMQTRSNELLGKTVQLEKTLRLLRQEVTQHEKFELDLRASEERFRRLSQSAPIGIFLLNAQGSTEYVNPALYAIFELEPELDNGVPTHEERPPNEASATLEGWLNAILGGEEFSHETQIWTHRGAMRWISISAVRMFDHQGRLAGYVGTMEDITSLKLTEQALRESEKRYREVVENANEAIVVVQGGFPKFWNSQVTEMFGYSRDEFGAWPFDSHIHPDDRKSVAREHHDLLEGGDRSSIHAFRIITQNGNEKWVEQSGVRIQWESGPASLIFLSDITERKKAEQALRQAHDALELEVANRTSELTAANIKLTNEIEERRRGEEALREHEELLHATVEATADGILVVDENRLVTHYNTRFVEMFAAPIMLMSTRDYGGILRFMARQVQDSQAFKENALGSLKTSQTDFNTLYFKDGRVMEEYSSPLIWENETMGRVWSFRDITATKVLESQLIRSERLAATGQLAASVAHEINSPLQAITMMIGTLRRKHGGDPEFREQMDLLKGAFVNIRDTVKNLLDLNRPGKEVRQPTDVNQVVRMTVGLSRSYLKKQRVMVRLDLDDALPEIVASPQQLSQVVLNLINNAMEAMASVERMPGLAPAPSSTITISTCLAGDHVLLKVSDTGPGIGEKDLNKIFDPFFTRKKKMGMGVGLSICHGIIEEHKGSIAAANAPEGGAIFTITLPLNVDARKWTPPLR